MASPSTAPARAAPTTPVIDIGGTGLKASVLADDGVGMAARVRIYRSPPVFPEQLVAQVSN